MHRQINPSPSHDVFWIFLLWRALHGGDPTLADVAAAAIASLAQFLPVQENSFGLLPPPTSLHLAAAFENDESEELECNDGDADALDVLPDQDDGQTIPSLFCRDPREFRVGYYYFSFKGVFYRLDRPAFSCLPTAA